MSNLTPDELARLRLKAKHGMLTPEEQQAYLVKPKAKIDSAFTLMFLATVLEKAIKDKFSYDDKCVWDKAKLLTVTLPCTSDNEPDWAYMDEYMRTIMESAASDLSAMQSIG